MLKRSELKHNSQARQALRPQAGQALRPQAGQALVEFLPSIMLFMIVMGSGFSYYRVMRNAQIREESVRNLLFQKINYTGTLTTNLTQPQKGIVVAGREKADRQPAQITESANCVGAVAGDAVKTVGDNAIFSLIDQLPSINIRTYAVIYRFPRGPTCTP